MPSYLIRWEINYTADTTLEAAEWALSVQRDLDSDATVFEVMDEETGELVKVDAETKEVLRSPKWINYGG